MKTAKGIARAAIWLLVVLAPATGWAQTSNGTLVGSVTDPAGAVVPKATVAAVSPQYGHPHETHTDSVGTYRLESLQPGIYTVTITAAGFETLTVNQVTITGSLTTTINGKLVLATAQQTIEVQASAAQAIDTQSGQLGENITRQEISDLPYASLNPAELAMTLPGVHDIPAGQGAVDTSNLYEGVSFSVNGTRPRANNFLIDGQDDNDYGITGQAYQPTNYGAIQEVTFLTNSYSAEYGRGGGSVTNYIYKSGTNNFHGDLWEINRNSALASIPAQDPGITKNPYDNENTFGFDAGGPVIKDKLFAFGSAQWDRERQAATGPLGFYLPTPAGIATLKTLLPNPNISLLLTSMGTLAGTPTTASPAVCGTAGATPGGSCLEPIGSGRPNVEIGPFQLQNVRTVSNAYDWNYRMDWQFSQRDALTGSIIRQQSSLTPDNFANPDALPNFQTEQSGHSELIRGQWAHTISSSLVNEARFSYTNINFGFVLTPATASSPLANTPWIQFGNDINFPAIGVDSNFPQARAHNIYQIQDSLSYSANRHTIKAGIDLTILSLQDTLPLNTRGTITYNFNNAAGGVPAYSSLGNFIDDTTGQNPGGISKGFGNPNLHSSANMVAPFIEDTWRVRSDLTVNMGLRYEYWGALANSLAYPAFNTGLGVGIPIATAAYADPTNPALFNSLFSFKQVPDKKNFAPRLGVAYSPHWGKFLFGDGKTVIRAGYGIFYDGLFSNIVDNSAESQPNTFGGSALGESGRGTPSASTFPGIGPTLNPNLILFSMASNLHNPLTQQWNVDVQRDLPLGLVLTLAYVGTRGDHLFANQDFNPGVGYDSTTFLVDYTNPNFQEIAVRTNNGQSWYNSGQIELERKIRTLTLRTSYTYSKFLDDASEIVEVGTTLAVNLSSYPQVLTNQHSDWGPSVFDQRHRFSAAYVWQVPYFHRNAFLRALTDQWDWSGIASIESGMPNTVELGFDNQGNGHPNSRPDLSNPNAPLDSIGIDGGNIFVGLTPGAYYDFHCIFTVYVGCAPEPASNFHFLVPAQTLVGSTYVGPPGNVGRNSIYGPGQIYFDTSIQRDFPIRFFKRENDRLSFRVDLFNAFNHPNFFTPSYTFTDSNYDNTNITITGQRQIKLWLKYSF